MWHKTKEWKIDQTRRERQKEKLANRGVDWDNMEKLGEMIKEIKKRINQLICSEYCVC